MNQIAKGEFTVKLQPLAMEGLPEASRLGRLSIDKTITGDLVATTAAAAASCCSTAAR
jgi:hypothetical protein